MIIDTSESESVDAAPQTPQLHRRRSFSPEETTVLKQEFREELSTYVNVTAAVIRLKFSNSPRLRKQFDGLKTTKQISDKLVHLRETLSGRKWSYKTI